MRLADEIVVLDTGSTDETVAKLKKLGVKVAQKIHPEFRFDIARNESLSLVPHDTDICVCTDLDEVFEGDWRTKIERAWSGGTTLCRYRYIWSHIGDKSGVEFYANKIHAYGAYRWIYPVHEVLEFDSEYPLKEKTLTLTDLVLHHYPDQTKSRASYLPLLELCAVENPNCDRTAHYLGREYYFHRRYDDAIAWLKRHLGLKNATWLDERVASMRIIAKCYEQKGEFALAERWYLKAVSQDVNSREAWVEYQTFLYNRGDYDGVIYAGVRAISIKNKNLSYITDPIAWGERAYDLLSIAYYNVGDYENAVKYGTIAHEISPTARIWANLKLYKKAFLSV